MSTSVLCSLRTEKSLFLSKFNIWLCHLSFAGFPLLTGVSSKTPEQDIYKKSLFPVQSYSQMYMPPSVSHSSAPIHSSPLNGPVMWKCPKCGCISVSLLLPQFVIMPLSSISACQTPTSLLKSQFIDFFFSEVFLNTPKQSRAFPSLYYCFALYLQ